MIIQKQMFNKCKQVYVNERDMYGTAISVLLRLPVLQLRCLAH